MRTPRIPVVCLECGTKYTVHPQGQPECPSCGNQIDFEIRTLTRDCDSCGQPSDELHSVETCPRTHSSPAEHEDWCETCVQQPRRPKSQHERHQRAADAGCDTWDEVEDGVK